MAMVVRLCDEFGEHSCFAWVRVKSVLVKEEGCCGGFVFLVLKLQGPRSMRKEPLLSMGREGIVGFGGWVHLEREQ